MSYLQGYGHPSVFSSQPADDNTGGWVQAGSCDTSPGLQQRVVRRLVTSSSQPAVDSICEWVQAGSCDTSPGLQERGVKRRVPFSSQPADDNTCGWVQAGSCDTSPGLQQRVVRRRLTLSSQPAVDSICEWVQAGSCDTSPVVQQRIVKRRSTANKKERRRTLSLNKGFGELRSCIPQVPVDTKLSKIKTLKLAISYIYYLRKLLEQPDSAKSAPPPYNTQVVSSDTEQPIEPTNHIEALQVSDIKKASGRTGWPQAVWALGLKREKSS